MKLKGPWLLSLENKLLTFVLQAERVWGIFRHYTTLPSFCPMPLVKTPHPVPPDKHTHTPAVGIPLN